MHRHTFGNTEEASRQDALDSSDARSRVAMMWKSQPDTCEDEIRLSLVFHDSVYEKIGSSALLMMRRTSRKTVGDDTEGPSLPSGSGSVPEPGTNGADQRLSRASTNVFLWKSTESILAV